MPTDSNIQNFIGEGVVAILKTIEVCNLINRGRRTQAFVLGEDEELILKLAFEDVAIQEEYGFPEEEDEEFYQEFKRIYETKANFTEDEDKRFYEAFMFQALRAYADLIEERFSNYIADNGLRNLLENPVYV